MEFWPGRLTDLSFEGIYIRIGVFAVNQREQRIIVTVQYA
jgi:hypothetical protein